MVPRGGLIFYLVTKTRVTELSHANSADCVWTMANVSINTHWSRWEAGHNLDVGKAEGWEYTRRCSSEKNSSPATKRHLLFLSTKQKTIFYLFFFILTNSNRKSLTGLTKILFYNLHKGCFFLSPPFFLQSQTFRFVSFVHAVFGMCENEARFKRISRVPDNQWRMYNNSVFVSSNAKLRDLKVQQILAN